MGGGHKRKNIRRRGTGRGEGWWTHQLNLHTMCVCVSLMVRCSPVDNTIFCNTKFVCARRARAYGVKLITRRQTYAYLCRYIWRTHIQYTRIQFLSAREAQAYTRGTPNCVIENNATRVNCNIRTYIMVRR